MRVNEIDVSKPKPNSSNHLPSSFVRAKDEAVEKSKQLLAQAEDERFASKECLIKI